MKPTVTLAMLLSAMGWVAPTVAAQQPACTSQTVLVSVADRKGELANDLKPENFRGTYRGKAVQIRTARWTTHAVRVVIVLDTSGSIVQNSKWQMAKNLAIGLADGLPDNSQVAIVTFGDRARRLVDLPSVKSRALSALQALGTNQQDKVGVGKSALLDAIHEAILLLQPAQLGDVVYIISDGGENASRHRPEEIFAELRKAGIRLFASALQILPNRGADNIVMTPPDVLGSIAQATGGEVVTTPVQEDYSRRRFELTPEQLKLLAEAAKHICSRLVQYYELEIELPSPIDKPRDWKLEIVGADGKKQGNLQVAYMRRLVPCPR